MLRSSIGDTHSPDWPEGRSEGAPLSWRCLVNRDSVKLLFLCQASLRSKGNFCRKEANSEQFLDGKGGRWMCLALPCVKGENSDMWENAETCCWLSADLKIEKDSLGAISEFRKDLKRTLGLGRPSKRHPGPAPLDCCTDSGTSAVQVKPKPISAYDVWGLSDKIAGSCISRAAKRGGFKRGGFLIWTCPSFCVLFCPFLSFFGTFPIFVGFSRFARGWSGDFPDLSFSSFSAY